jgi:UDP-glucose 4-epimerase
METKIRTALVTGGAGYLGSILSKYLKQTGWRVVIYDKKPPKHPYVDCVVVDDILNREMVNTVFSQEKIDVVFHLAARIEVGESEKHPTEFWEVNVGGTVIVLNAMKRHGVNKIIFSSTAGVYFSSSILIPEDEATINNSVYSNTKLACENAIIDSGMDFVIFRYFNLAGADDDLGEDHDPETHLIPKILQNLNNFEIYGDEYDTPDGTCIRDYVHVLDVVEAHLKAVKYLDDKNESIILNLGTGRGYSVLEVIDVVEKVTGQKVAYSFVDKREGDPKHLVANINLAKELINYEPQYKIDTIIKSAYEWEKKRVGR